MLYFLLSKLIKENNKLFIFVLVFLQYLNIFIMKKSNYFSKKA